MFSEEWAKPTLQPKLSGTADPSQPVFSFVTALRSRHGRAKGAEGGGGRGLQADNSHVARAISIRTAVILLQ
jgi:hypothetical protein